MKILLPAHNKPAVKVKNWKEIEEEALELRKFVRKGKYEGHYLSAYAISHAQISNEPKSYFVINENLRDRDTGIKLKKWFGHWCIINLEILDVKEKMRYNEACMSFPFRGPKWTDRFRIAKVKYWVPFWFGLLRPVRKKLKDVPAIVAQHEEMHSSGKNIYGKYQ